METLPIEYVHTIMQKEDPINKAAFKFTNGYDITHENPYTLNKSQRYSRTVKMQTVERACKFPKFHVFRVASVFFFLSPIVACLLAGAYGRRHFCCSFVLGNFSNSVNPCLSNH